MRSLRALLSGLPRRAWLTLRHLGPREFGRRLLAFPQRLFAPSAEHPVPEPYEYLDVITGWYAMNARPVAVVIPTYGDPSLVRDAVRSVRATTHRGPVRIIVADDGSSRRHVRALRRIAGIELVEGRETLGFAGNCNRGIDRLEPGEDLVLLNSDVIAHPDWLDVLQHTAYHSPGAGIVGPKLLYPDGTIQSAGSVRNAGAPEWFDHRYRFKPADHPPANQLPTQCLAVTGAAMYVRRDCLEAIGGRFDEAYGMAFEDTDWCLRAWEAGWRVYYVPWASLTHLESKTRGMRQGTRELASQRLFWERWGAWLDERDVAAADGRLRVIYVTATTGVGGGHRVVFQHLVALREAGHEAELWSLEDGPEWFDLGDVRVRSFGSYGELERALAPVAAIKVATWWHTAETVWPAAVRRGLPAYFVQDIETSYYDHDPDMHGRVIDSYRQEFHTLTTSTWNAERLQELHVRATIVPPGIDEERFRMLPDVARRDDVVLALGRTDPLKNFPLTRAAWDALPAPRPQLWLFGIEPDLADADGIRYVVRPSDTEVNRLLNAATVFVQTSRHEGYCLPILEAMAAGAPVVCTDADGNRDFCEHEVNCLMVEPQPRAVAAAIERLLGDPALRGRLAEGGLVTARQHAWSRRSEEVVAFYERLGRVEVRA